MAVVLELPTILLVVTKMYCCVVVLLQEPLRDPVQLCRGSNNLFLAK